MKLLLSLAMTASLLAQQGVDTGMLLQRPTKNWPTFNGDYTGQRFSPLKQINTSWPNAEIMARGGGMTWVQGVYDPALNLTYWGTGDPHPVRAGNVRRGANLFTCTLVALDVDTGKMKWYIQTSPHDTYDCDANQTPILIDGDYQGKPRKLLAMASRSGYYFLLDRATGESLVTVPYRPTELVRRRGQARAADSQDRDRSVRRRYVLRGHDDQLVGAELQPQTGLFYVNGSHGFSIGYLMPNEETGNVEDHQGGGATGLWSESMLLALDYRTGKVRWSRTGPRTGAGNGILSTAGGLVFTNESGHLVALDAASGKVLWHVNPGGNLTGSPMSSRSTAASSFSLRWTESCTPGRCPPRPRLAAFQMTRDVLWKRDGRPEGRPLLIGVGECSSPRSPDPPAPRHGRASLRPLRPARV